MSYSFKSRINAFHKNNNKYLNYFRMGDVFKQSTMVFTEQTGLEKLYR